jgi:hypothetical protein
MTVRLLVKYGKMEPNTLYRGSNEADLLARNIATSDTFGGVEYDAANFVFEDGAKWQTPVSLKMDENGDALFADNRELDFGGLTSRSSVAWADLPSPSSIPEGAYRYVQDIGTGGSLWRSNGTTWSIVGGSIVLAQSAVAMSVSNTTAEEVLASVLVPGGLMGVNGALRLTTLWSITSSANNKTLRARIGSTALGGSAWIANVATTVGSLNLIPQVLRNRNAVNSQVTYPAANAGATVSTGTAISTFSEDTSVDTIVSITGQKANAGETITLEAFTLELLR